MFARSVLDTARSVTSVVPSGSFALIVLCIVYSYDSEGVSTPDLPTRKFKPARGATARAAPSGLTYAPPTPVPRKKYKSLSIAKRNDGSTIADHTDDHTMPAAMFV